MQWSPQQDQALRAVASWYRGRKSPLFRLFGYAGTGKTSLARHFAESVDGEVLFAAYTGKAASVLRAKGCPNASTIHQLIYLPRERSKKQLTELRVRLLNEALAAGFQSVDDPAFQATPAARRLEAEIEAELQHLRQPSFGLNDDALITDASLVIIDECSMVDQQMASDLLSFNVPILVLGDPAQLAPVKGGGGAFTTGEPDFMLTEIHRQAADNPILHLATLARQGKALPLGTYGDSRVIRKAEAAWGLLAQHDQILVGRNETRHRVNRGLRDALKHDPAGPPVVGEKLVCLRNDHNIGLLNGTLWTVEHCDVSGVDMWDEDARLLLDLSEFGEADPYRLVDVVAFGDVFYGINDRRPWAERKAAHEFDFGYALTCHKAQGSQWNSVLVRDESFAFSRERSQWLYTAVTRAAQSVTVVKD